MNDMSAVIVPKSDQINADDLMAGPRTITITRVEITPGTEQPVSIFFEGDGGKPYRSCKSMSRVLVAIWGPDASVYVGRSMTIYRDPDVTWGGMAVGGIRISHMSHMDAPVVLALTATKKARKPFRVLPLVIEAPKDPAADIAAEIIAAVDAAEDGPTLFALVDNPTIQKRRAALKERRPELSRDVEAAFMAAQQRISKPAAPTEKVKDDDVPF